MTAETADYDAVMSYIQEARELTLRLAVVLAPPLVGTALMCALIAVQWVLSASIVTFAVSTVARSPSSSDRERRELWFLHR